MGHTAWRGWARAPVSAPRAGSGWGAPHLKREAEVQPPLSSPLFAHFDWWAPLLQPGVHYVHVKLARRGAKEEVCTALAKALDDLDAVPRRAKCIAEAGQRLARSLTMERVYSYVAGVIRRAAAAQRPDVVHRQLAGGVELNVVTKRNLHRHLSNSTRPWMERRFFPWHSINTSRARPRALPRARRSFTFSR